MDKIKEQLAKNITKYFEMDEKSEVLLTDDYTTVEFLELLVSEELYTDAVNLLSHSLPNREAVWWACICAKHNKEDDDLYNETVKATEQWVYDPTEKNRRMTEFYAVKGKYETAAAWAAAAAFWSGDNVVAENEPKIAPDPYLYAHAVTGSILTAVCLQNDENQSKAYEKYIGHGINIAKGGNG